MSEVILNESNFEEEVINSQVPVLVDFWAPWCGPCKMLAPSLTKLADENEGKIKVGKVNVDEFEVLAQSFNVSSLPTILLFKNGEIVADHVGAASYGLLQAMIADHI